MILVRGATAVLSLLAVAIAPALAAEAKALKSSMWFEPADARNSNWIVRGPGIEAGISSGAFSLVGQSGNILDVQLDGASGAAVIQGEEPLSARSFYFHGNNQSAWRGAPHFRRIRANNIYPGIDAIYYDGPHGLEADFAVSPGSDPSRVRIQFKNRLLTLDPAGNLRDKSSGEILMAAPAAWQGSGESRKTVHAGFRILAPDRVAFRFDRWDRSRALLIDPTLTYATYFGGSGRDTVVGVETGADGRFYVAGNTTSVDLPLGVSLNSPLIRPVSLPLEDTFVACYNADGSLAYVVYVGGNGQDLATSLALDPSGRPTVAGYSKSADFPTTLGAYSAATSNPDAFVYRVSSDGGTLEYSTFLRVVAFGAGLPSSALTFLVSVDASGAATIGGTATTFTPALSSTAFVEVGPTATPGVFQTAPAGGNDIFLMRLRPDGTGVQWATYFGGTHNEALTGMALDAAGDVLVAGTTNSNDLPLVSPFQSAPPTASGSGYTYGASTAGFFARFAPDAKSVISSTYVGGQTLSTYLSSVAVDDTGAIYLAGTSPISAAPGLTAIPGAASPYTPQSPAMILKLDPTATVKQYFLSYGTLTAGSVTRIRVDSSHQPCILTYLGGAVSVVGALPGNPGYPGSGFACLGPDGATVSFTTMLPGFPGAIPPSPVDFALTPDGTLIGAANLVTGLPVTANAPQQAPVDTMNGYIFKIQPQNPAPQLLQINPPLIFTPLPGSTSTTSLTLLGSNFVIGETVLWNGAPVSLTNLGGYSSATSISGTLSATALSALPKGNVQIQVSMAGPGGGVSNPLTLRYINPSPGSITVSPQVVSVGSGPVTFTVTGGLTSDCSIAWNGAPQTLVPAGSAGFRFTVPASAFSAAGIFSVVASNPAPGGGSATAQVSVTSTGLPAPNPTGAVVVGVGQGGVTQTLTVNFAPDDSVVVWNGNDRPTSRLNSTTLQFILTQNDVQQMGSAQFQIRSGGVLSPAVTAYVGLPVANSHVVGDPVRALAYFAGAGSGGSTSTLAAVSLPSGNTVRTVDLAGAIQSLFMTDDNAYLWVSTMDGRITRVNADTFAIDATATVPGPLSVYSSMPAVIPVPGTSSTIVAAGVDGVLRIFDSGVQRGFSSADLYPAPPGGLIPIFATPDAVWAETGVNAPNCFVRLTWDYTGFSGFAQTCANTTSPWELPSPELKMDAGVSYFQSGLDTLVWSSPRTGYVDFAKRRILSSQIASYQIQSGFYYAYSDKLAVYDLDSEAQTVIVPSAGYLPAGSFAPYSESQGLWSASNMLLVVGLP